MTKNGIFKNNYRAKLFVIAALSLSAIGTVSYGSFYIYKNQEGENTISSRCFSTDFKDFNSINLAGGEAIPLADEEGLNTTPYHFEITNTCNVKEKYYVILSTKSDSFDNSFLKYSIGETNSTQLLSDSTLNSLYPIDDGYSSSYIISSGILDVDKTARYDIRIWLDEATLYDQVAGKSWEAEIKVVGNFTNEDDENSANVSS